MTNKIVLSRIFLAAISAGAWLPPAGEAAPGDLYAAGGTSIIIVNPDASKAFFIQNQNPMALAFDGAGNFFSGEPGFRSIFKFTPGNRAPTNQFAAGVDPAGLAFDRFGTLYETDTIAGTIFKFTPTGTKSTFFGGLDKPTGLAFDASGRLFVAESATGAIYRYTTSGLLFRTTFATGLNTPQALAFDAAGNLYVAESGAGNVLKFAPDGSRSTFASGLVQPQGLAFDSFGNLFVTQLQGTTGSIFQFTPAGGKSLFTTVQGNLFNLVFEPTLHHFLNISTRSPVGTGDDVLIGGFIMNGNGQVQQNVVVRAIGPSLTGFGVANALQNPILELHGPDGATITTNDNWKDSQQALIQSTGLAPSDDRESAIYATLPAGHYTAVVRGVGNATGNALVEVYNLQ